MLKLIIATAIVVLLAVFFSIYESIFLLYYEENRADHYTYIIAIPILIYIFVYILNERLKYSFKDGAERKVEAIKEACTGVVGLGLFYYVFLTPVMSGVIILTNTLIGKPEAVTIKGNIVTVESFSTAKVSSHELTIALVETDLVLDTNGVEVKKHQVGDAFQADMMKGFWGLIYKNKY